MDRWGERWAMHEAAQPFEGDSGLVDLAQLVKAHRDEGVIRGVTVAQLSVQSLLRASQRLKSLVIFFHAILGDAEHRQVESGPRCHLVGYLSLTKCSPVRIRIPACGIYCGPTVLAEFVRWPSFSPVTASRPESPLWVKSCASR